MGLQKSDCSVSCDYHPIYESFRLHGKKLETDLRFLLEVYGFPGQRPGIAASGL